MSKILVFHGTDHKVGTTMIAQSVAEVAADADTGYKVLMLSLNNREGLEYVKGKGETIEGIKASIDSQVLDKEEFFSRCKKTKNLYMLGGICTPGNGRHYFPETAAYLINTFRDDFDLIIGDSGNSPDSGLAIGALIEADIRCCVFTQQETALERFKIITSLYENINVMFDVLAVNKYEESDPYDLAYINSRLGVDENRMIKIEDTSRYARQAERDRKSLLNYKNNDRYKQDITALANLLLQKEGMEPIRAQRKKKWINFT